MTKAERERVRRHAAVIAIASATAPDDPELAPWDALRRWRGDDAGAKANHSLTKAADGSVADANVLAEVQFD